MNENCQNLHLKLWLVGQWRFGVILRYLQKALILCIFVSIFFLPSAVWAATYSLCLGDLHGYCAELDIKSQSVIYSNPQHSRSKKFGAAEITSMSEQFTGFYKTLKELQKGNMRGYFCLKRYYVKIPKQRRLGVCREEIPKELKSEMDKVLVL